MGSISVSRHIVKRTAAISAFNFCDVKIAFGSVNPDCYARLFVADFAFSDYFSVEV